MALDTNAVEQTVPRPFLCPCRRRPGGWAPMSGGHWWGGGRLRFGHWIGNVIASGIPTWRAVARTTWPSPWAVDRCGGLAGRRRDARLPAGQAGGREPLPPAPSKSWTRTSPRAGPQGHRTPVHDRRAAVLLHRWLMAMAIRTELLNPTNHVFGPGTYIALVSEHGTIMMMMASSISSARSGTGWCPDDRVADAWPSRASSLSPCGFSPPLPGHLERPAARRLPERGGQATRRCRRRRQGHGLLLGGLRRHRHRHDLRRINLLATIINYRAPA